MSAVYGGEFPGPPMADIKPALTAEEWTRDPIVIRDGFEIHMTADRAPWLSIGLEGSEDGYAIAPDAFHAIAALCLHEQPFGFTREDVVIMERLGFMLGRADLEDLAKRIDALLRPEK